ncbi:MAG: dTMP kinase [bacterium]|nr:dTMP kinase [bacterium]
MRNKMAMVKRGKFIVLDGVDGCGKGTQAKLLTAYIFDKSKDNHVCLTREPYRSRYYQEIRRLLKSGLDPLANALRLAWLFVADRKVHVKMIFRHLREVHHIISDRYKYSTLAYQQAQGVSLKKLIAMHRGILVPDLTIIVDVPIKVALQRIKKDIKGGKRYKEVFEQKAFQEKLRKNMLALPKQLPKERIVVINGNQSKEKVFEAIRREVDKIL